MFSGCQVSASQAMATRDQNSGKDLITRISFVGMEEGQVKRFPDFDKRLHTAPKFASDRAQQFLGRLAGPDLNEWGEELFAAFREAMGYRRKEIAFVSEGGTGRVESKDFTVERRYSLIEDRPDCYSVETELLEIGSANLLEDASFNGAMGPLFECMRCLFSKSVSVEGIIDGLEEASDRGLSIEYPSSCEYCDARIENMNAIFRFDAVSLEIRFPGFGTPGQLVESYRGLIENLGGAWPIEDVLPLL